MILSDPSFDLRFVTNEPYSSIGEKRTFPWLIRAFYVCSKASSYVILSSMKKSIVFKSLLKEEIIIKNGREYFIAPLEFKRHFLFYPSRQIPYFLLEQRMQVTGDKGVYGDGLSANALQSIAIHNKMTIENLIRLFKHEVWHAREHLMYDHFVPSMHGKIHLDSCLVLLGGLRTKEEKHNFKERYGFIDLFNRKIDAIYCPNDNFLRDGYISFSVLLRAVLPWFTSPLASVFRKQLLLWREESNIDLFRDALLSDLPT